MTFIRVSAYVQMPQMKSWFHCAMLYKHTVSILAPKCLYILSIQKKDAGDPGISGRVAGLLANSNIVTSQVTRKRNANNQEEQSKTKIFP